MGFEGGAINDRLHEVGKDTYIWAACDCDDRTSGGGTAWFWEDLDDIDMV